MFFSKFIIYFCKLTGWMEVIGKDGRGRGSHGSIHSVVGSGV